eukprot:GFYU01012058.1.p1 GENE.GFYU01012058.1~~GFYU01012058.1.p1  ORF type:complete len:182 (-),score=22.23 GFYU01012058.1:18-563(-)
MSVTSPDSKSVGEKRSGFKVPTVNLPEFEAYRIEPTALRQKLTELDATEALTVIDVRDDDFVGGHIPNAVHVPWSMFDRHVEELVQKYVAGVGERLAVLVVYDMSSGSRAPACADLLLQAAAAQGAGKVQVLTLAEGFQGWLSRYVDERDLVTEYNAEYWNNGEHVLATNESELGSVQDRQ